MKENSIERDIHLLESYAGMTHKMNDNQGRPKLDQAIEHILSDYKRVLKENEELKNDYKNLSNSVVVKNYCIKNSIPIQKVKDKIEELKNNPLKIKQNDKYYYETHAYNKIIIGVLQELIEEREENNGKNI